MVYFPKLPGMTSGARILLNLVIFLPAFALCLAGLWFGSCTYLNAQSDLLRVWVEDGLSYHQHNLYPVATKQDLQLLSFYMTEVCDQKARLAKTNPCRFNLWWCVWAGALKKVLFPWMSLRASRSWRLCAVTDQRLQHKDLKSAGNSIAMKMRWCCVWISWWESPGIYLWNVRQINEIHVAHWAACINDLLPVAGSQCSFVLLLQEEIAEGSVTPHNVLLSVLAAW